MQEVEEFEVKTSELEQQLKESEEKLQLVVEFPSIDAKQSTQSQSDKGVMFSGEGPSEAEVAQDMERQVMANNIRIMTLEEQNDKLRKSIAFLMNARENISKKKVGAYCTWEIYDKGSSDYFMSVNSNSLINIIFIENIVTTVHRRRYHYH